MQFTVSQLSELVAGYFWPFARIAAMIMVAPVFSASMVPVRVRLLTAIALTVLVAPLVPAIPAVAPLSGAGMIITLQQFVIGAAMGFALQMVFDALVIAGQAIAMTMGLGFAMAIDPARGVSVPVLSQYFVLLATLIFLSLNGHLLLINALADSFHSLPIGGGGIGREGLWELVAWGTQMFVGALQVALPALTALLMVNLAFGVISRAAPTLNLFAVGFPVTMFLGFIIILMSLPNIGIAFAGMLGSAFENIGNLVNPGARP